MSARPNFKEKDFQTRFNKWLKYVHQTTGVFELKVSPGASIPFNALEEHQKNALNAAKNGSVVFKIPDCGYQNPFDVFMVAGVPAYVVVMFHSKDRGQNEFFMIDIDVWSREEEESERKSLTLDRAREVGVSCVLAAS